MEYRRRYNWQDIAGFSLSTCFHDSGWLPSSANRVYKWGDPYIAHVPYKVLHSSTYENHDYICYIQHTAYIQITYELHLSHMNFIQTTYKLHTLTYSLHTAYITSYVTYKLHTIYIQFTHKLHKMTYSLHMNTYKLHQ